MLTLRRREQEPVGLQYWLTSTDPIQQQFAAECLAEMGDTHGTDCLILLASAEDSKRRHKYYTQSYIVGTIWMVLFFSTLPFAILPMMGLTPYCIAWLTMRKAKTSRLQQAAIQKLAEGRNPATVGALVDALWKPEPDLKEAATQGLTKLLFQASRDLHLSGPQWELLMNEISLGRLVRQKTTVNIKLIIAILKAAAAADYFPAMERMRELTDARKTICIDETIRSVAAQCYAQLRERHRGDTPLSSAHPLRK